jgi:hypothetical protein
MTRLHYRGISVFGNCATLVTRRRTQLHLPAPHCVDVDPFCLGNHANVEGGRRSDVFDGVVNFGVTGATFAAIAFMMHQSGRKPTWDDERLPCVQQLRGRHVVAVLVDERGNVLGEPHFVDTSDEDGVSSKMRDHLRLAE